MEDCDMGVRLTTLVEDSLGDHESLAIEHGLSFYIETNEGSLIFDTGQSDAFINNASFLNISPLSADAVVISHGHYDHSGGFYYLAEQWDYSRPLNLYVGEDFFKPKYSRRGEALRFVGNRFTKSQLLSKNIKVHELNSQATEIMPNIFVVTSFERSELLETDNPRLVFYEGGVLRSDDLRDEVALVIQVESGIVLVVGCSHPGIMNIVESVKKHFDKPILAIVGGTHLKEAQGERLQRAVNTLAAMDGTIIGVSHCTGREATELLEKKCKRFFHNSTGTCLMIE